MDSNGGDGAVCAIDLAICTELVPGPTAASEVMPAASPVLPFVNGIEINRAAIIEAAHEHIINRKNHAQD